MTMKRINRGRTGCKEKVLRNLEFLVEIWLKKVTTDFWDRDKKFKQSYHFLKL